MAAYAKQFLFFLFVACISVIGDPTVKLADVNDCEVFCHHLSITVEQPRSCDRGCRLFSISSFLARETGDPLTQCHNSCSEAYSPKDPSNLESCNQGCTKQSELMSGNDGKEASSMEEEEGSDGAVFNLGTPIMQVRKVMAQVMGGIHILKTSVITYFMQDDNTLIAVQSRPLTIVEVVPGESFKSPEEVLTNSEEQSKESSSPNKDGNSVFGNELLSRGDFGDGLESSGSAVTRISLTSRRYAYLLHLLLLLAVVSLSLLGLSYCLAIARHQQRKTLKASNLHVALQEEPLKLVRPEDLTKLSLMEEDDSQAPPLPNKHDLALTHANV